MSSTRIWKSEELSQSSREKKELSVLFRSERKRDGSSHRKFSIKKRSPDSKFYIEAMCRIKIEIVNKGSDSTCHDQSNNLVLSMR